LKKTREIFATINAEHQKNLDTQIEAKTQQKLLSQQDSDHQSQRGNIYLSSLHCNLIFPDDDDANSSAHNNAALEDPHHSHPNLDDDESKDGELDGALAKEFAESDMYAVQKRLKTDGGVAGGELGVMDLGRGSAEV
jgi:hypothetical protein